MHFPPPLPPEPAGSAVPRYHKLSFPTYDGKDDPLGWLNKCEQFFHGQQTRHADRVWLASYHLISTPQQWYLVLENDADRPSWDEFRLLCQQRFGPPLCITKLEIGETCKIEREGIAYVGGRLYSNQNKK
jgi:hypothetical protein